MKKYYLKFCRLDSSKIVFMVIQLKFLDDIFCFFFIFLNAQLKCKRSWATTLVIVKLIDKSRVKTVLYMKKKIK